MPSKIVNGFAWSFVERFGVLGVNFIVQIVLARLIAPEYFGIIATTTILLQISTVIVDGGLGAALIQRKEINRTDISTVFYINLSIAVIVLLTAFLFSSNIANYFREPALENVVPALAVGLIFTAVGKTQMDMLIKELQFQKVARISFPSTLVGGAIGLVMAYGGFNVWALVAQRLTTQGLNSVLLWSMCPARIQPNFKFSNASFKKLAGFSMGILGNSIIMQITRNLIGLIVARVFGAEDLAYYNRARFFQKAPTEPLLALLNRVLFPVFSEVQDDNEKIRNALRRGIPMLMFVVAPIMFVMIATSETMILAVLGEAWLPTASYLQVVPLIGITFALSAVKSTIIRAKGDGRLIFILSIVRNGLSILVLSFTWQYGIMAMVIGQIIVYVINMIINDVFTYRYIDYKLTEQWSDWFAYILVAALCCIPDRKSVV